MPSPSGRARCRSRCRASVKRTGNLILRSCSASSIQPLIAVVQRRDGPLRQQHRRPAVGSRHCRLTRSTSAAALPGAPSRLRDACLRRQDWPMPRVVLSSRCLAGIADANFVRGATNVATRSALSLTEWVAVAGARVHHRRREHPTPFRCADDDAAPIVIAACPLSPAEKLHASASGTLPACGFVESDPRIP